MLGCKRFAVSVTFSTLLAATVTFASPAAMASTARANRTTHLPPASTGLVDLPLSQSRKHVVLTHALLRNGSRVRVRHEMAFERTSFLQQSAARNAVDTGPLSLQSNVALVMDESSSNILFAKNTDVPVPMASITKLMTTLVVLEANQNMDEMLEVTDDEIDTEKHTTSRLAIGTILSRRDLMHIALMSSENRAAHALCRNYPGGLPSCLNAMNAKAAQLGMTHTHYNDPTGLSKENVASAEDLAKLVQAASQNPTIREFTTDTGYTVPVGRRMVAYHNTNQLVSNPAWDIVLQKTGFINEAGKCLVMKAKIEGKNVLIVLLDSVGKYTRFGDANRIKKWVESRPHLLEASTPSPTTPSVAADIPHVTS
jgi:D-alanyl-D-alanine endopeptidase (penicillin-binding protein 7)